MDKSSPNKCSPEFVHNPPKIRFSDFGGIMDKLSPSEFVHNPPKA